MESRHQDRKGGSGSTPAGESASPTALEFERAVESACLLQFGNLAEAAFRSQSDFQLYQAVQDLLLSKAEAFGRSSSDGQNKFDYQAGLARRNFVDSLLYSYSVDLKPQAAPASGFAADDPLEEAARYFAWLDDLIPHHLGERRNFIKGHKYHRELAQRLESRLAQPSEPAWPQMVEVKTVLAGQVKELVVLHRSLAGAMETEASRRSNHRPFGSSLP